MNPVEQWIAGAMTPQQRVVSALLPAIIVFGTVVLAFVAYCLRCAIWGRPERWAPEASRHSGMLGQHLRIFFFWMVNPFWRLLLRTGISANGVTALAALAGVGAAVAVAGGRFSIGGWLFLLSGVLDALDGRVARERNTVSPAGAAIDSILDRYCDALMLIGLGIYYATMPWALLAVLLALMGTSLVPYVRAKSEALGHPVRDGAMQRPERVFYLGTSVALAPIFEAVIFPGDPRPVHWLAVTGVVFLAVTSNATAARRFMTLVRALEREGQAAAADPALVPPAAAHVDDDAPATSAEGAGAPAPLGHGRPA